jgi:hypothetical protein
MAVRQDDAVAVRQDDAVAVRQDDAVAVRQDDAVAVRQDDAMAIKWERGPGSHLVAEGVPAEPSGAAFGPVSAGA